MIASCQYGAVTITLRGRTTVIIRNADLGRDCHSGIRRPEFSAAAAISLGGKAARVGRFSRGR